MGGGRSREKRRGDIQGKRIVGTGRWDGRVREGTDGGGKDCGDGEMGGAEVDRGQMQGERIVGTGAGQK